MTDPMTPLTDESVDLVAEIHALYCEASAVRTRAWSPQVMAHQVEGLVADRLRAIEAAAARRAIEGSGAVEADELLELLIGILAEGPNGEYATIDAMERAAKTIHMEWHEAQGRWVTTDRTRPYRAARRALEGSGVVEAVEATRSLPEDAPNWRTDKANLYAAGWIDRGDAIRAALPRPEEPRAERWGHDGLLTHRLPWHGSRATACGGTMPVVYGERSEPDGRACPVCLDTPEAR